MNSASSVIWRLWNGTYATNSITSGTAATMMAYTNQIWSVWNAQHQTASATTGNSFGTTAVNTYSAVWGRWNTQLVDMRNATAEQVAQAQRQATAYRERQVLVQAERSLAEKRAEKLLQETLSAAQREELIAKGYFTLETIASSGERRIYRIRRGRSRNVDQVDATGRRIKTLCAHPVAMVPDADTMIAQKLMLESQEDEFLRIAYAS